MVNFPYYSHIFRDSFGSGMGIVWEVYHKGVPILGVPENPIELLFQPLLRMIGWIADQLMVQKFPTYSPVEGKLVCLPLFTWEL